MSHNPSKFLRKILRYCAPEHHLDDLEGDFYEMYNDIMKESGRWKANLVFIKDCLTLLPLKMKSKDNTTTNTTPVMLKNYFKITLRNLAKDKTYALINITGLALGMACAFIILAYVKLELSFDQFHTRSDQIHRMQHVYSFVGAPIGPAMVEEFPEIIDCTRIYPWATERKTIIEEEQVFYEDFYLADNNFFQTFTFDFIEGNAKTALTGPESLVITESVAIKYFGDANPIGQVIHVETLNHLRQTPLKVTAVIKDVPYNSQLQFTHVASFDIINNNPNIKIKDSWINDWIITYLILEKGADPKPVEEAYWDFYQKHTGVRYTSSFRIMPLTEVRHHSTYLRGDFIDQGNINHIYIFSAVAILVLIIACINYMNLATAKSTQRAKEVGIRKVMGAFKNQLLMQFLIESLAISSLALILGGAMVWFFIPSLEMLSGISIVEGLTDIKQIAFIVILVTLGTGLFAGSYPALHLSSFGASDVLRAARGSGKSTGLIRKILVIAQLAVSVGLIVSTLVVIDQMKFVSEKDLGFKTDQTLVIPYGRRPTLDEKWDLLKSEINQIPGVLSVASTRSVPGDNAPFWGYRFEGDTDDPDGYPGYYFGTNAMDLLEMEIIMGRTFSEDFETDKNAFILTEMAWEQAINQYGDAWKDPLGKTIEYSTTNSGDWQVEKTGPVIGVVKNFHSRSLQMPMEPLVLQMAPRSGTLLVKFNPQFTQEIIGTLENKWEALGSSMPFHYEFLDQQYRAYYESETRFSQLLYIFCGMAIFIACMGLFGLASFTAQQRIKEIGIRKVLGASISEIYGMITTDFLKLIGIAFLIGFPVAWYASYRWLENFAYRIDISWASFVIASVLIIALSIVTVSWQSLKASYSNPVNSLRQE